MKNIIFNSSMPRAGSTLLQNIFYQNPDFYATPTDGFIELIVSAKNSFTHADEFKASEDQDLMLKAWRNFCKKGLEGYTDALTDRKNVVLKGRGYISILDWMNNFLGERPKVVTMVRNMCGIVASFEKMYRKNPDKAQQWYIPNELRGTTLDKRVDMYLTNPPLAFSLDALKDVIYQGLDQHCLFCKVEDLTSNPKGIMKELYDRLGVDNFEHDFTNVEQKTHENDIIHMLDKDLHKIQNEIKPINEDYTNILPQHLIDEINSRCEWYQKYFGYID